MGLANINTKYVSYMPTVQKDDSQADNFVAINKTSRKREIQHQEEVKTNENHIQEKLLSSLRELNDKIAQFDKSTPTTPNDILEKFNSDSSRLQQQVENAKYYSQLSSKQVEDIDSWTHSVISELSQAQDHKDLETSLLKNTELLEKATELIHGINKQAQTKLPLAETISSRSALLSSKDEEVKSEFLSLQDSNSEPTNPSAATDTPSLASSGDINMYLVMLSLVVCGNNVTMNAVASQSRYNELLQDMMTDLQNFLALTSVVTSAYNDMQSQAIKNSSEDANNPSFGWEQQAKDQKDMADLLTQPGTDNAKRWDVISGGHASPKTQICFFNQSVSENDPRYTRGKVNPLIVKYASSGGDNKYYLDEDSLKNMLRDLGAQMAPVTGGDLASQNTDAFHNTTSVQGLVKSITSAQQNLQSQSGTVISKLNLANQGLVTAISNFTTLVSNLLSVMMKLAAV